MAEWYLLSLTALCAALLIAVIVRPQRIYEFPFFMAAGFAVFILPQAYTLVAHPFTVPLGSLETLLLMCNLCLIMCWAGYQCAPNPRLLDWLAIQVNESRLFHGGIALVIISSLANFMIGSLPEEAKGTQWTGAVTIYNFFSLLSYPGFAICLMSALRRPRLPAIGMTVIAAWSPIVAAVVYARREHTALFLVTLGTTLFYSRKLIPPRWLTGAVLVFTTLFLPATTLYRQMAKTGDWYLTDLRLVENFQRTFDEGQAPEFRLGAFLVAETTQTGQIRLGVDYWNQLVFRFVPAQLVGRDVKDGLALPSPPNDLDVQVLGIPVGTTVTGVAEAFAEFGYFGCLVFALMGVLFKNLWRATRTENGVFVQILYIQNITVGLRALSHQTTDFLPGFVYNTIFLSLIVFYARERCGRVVPARRAAAVGRTRV
jgi:hypothetical protein